MQRDLLGVKILFIIRPFIATDFCMTLGMVSNFTGNTSWSVLLNISLILSKHNIYYLHWCTLPYHFLNSSGSFAWISNFSLGLFTVLSEGRRTFSRFCGNALHQMLICFRFLRHIVDTLGVTQPIYSGYWKTSWWIHDNHEVIHIKMAKLLNYISIHYTYPINK